jgi:hypothetical protein
VHDSPDYDNLKVSLFNDDKKTELIGETWVSLTEVIVPGGGQSDSWFNLNCRGKYAGEVRMELTYYDTRPKPENPPVEKRRERSGTEDGQSVRAGNTPVKRRPLPSNPASASQSPLGLEPRPLSQGGPRNYGTPPRQQSYPQPRSTNHTPVQQRRNEYGNPEAQPAPPREPAPFSEPDLPEPTHRRLPSQNDLPDKSRSAYAPRQNVDAYPPLNAGYRPDFSGSDYKEPLLEGLPELPPMDNSRGRFARRGTATQEPPRPPIELPHSQSAPSVPVQHFPESRQDPRGLQHSQSEVVVPQTQYMSEYDEPHYDDYRHEQPQEPYQEYHEPEAEPGYDEPHQKPQYVAYHPDLQQNEQQVSRHNSYALDHDHHVPERDPYVQEHDPYGPPPTLQAASQQEADVPPPPPAHRSHGSTPLRQSISMPLSDYQQDVTPPPPLNISTGRNSIPRRPVSKDALKDYRGADPFSSPAPVPAHVERSFDDPYSSPAARSNYGRQEVTPLRENRPPSRDTRYSPAMDPEAAYQELAQSSPLPIPREHRGSIGRSRDPYSPGTYSPGEKRAPQSGRDERRNTYTSQQTPPVAANRMTLYNPEQPSPLSNRTPPAKQTPPRPYSMAAAPYEPSPNYHTPPRRHPLAQQSPAAMNTPMHSSPPVITDNAPLIKPRPISPNALQQEDYRQPRSVDRLTPSRKSVSPRPPDSTERPPSVPFDPDSFNQFNPHAPNARSSSSLANNPATSGANTPYDSGPNSQYQSPSLTETGKIVDFHGNEIDPSDRLPETSWAPEPEKKGPVKVYVRDRERLTGARAPGSTGSRDGSREVGRLSQLNTSANAPPPLAITSGPHISPGGSPTSLGDGKSTMGRNRLQKRNNAPTNIRPQSMAIVPSGLNQPVRDIPDVSSYGPGGYGSPSSYGSPGYSANHRNSYSAPPPIPAKIPLNDSGSPVAVLPSDLSALSEEMKRIDLGPSPGTTQKRTIRAKIFGRSSGI